MTRVVYFIKSGNAVKIGTTSSLEQRLATLQRQNSRALTLIGAIAGSYRVEKFIHEKLSAHRLHGEWFANVAEVRSLIETAVSGGAQAIGYIQPPKAGPERAVEPKQPFYILLGKLTASIWGDDRIEGLSALLEQEPSDCEKWISGAEAMPRVLRMAFASFLISWMMERHLDEQRAKRAAA